MIPVWVPALLLAAVPAGGAPAGGAPPDRTEVARTLPPAPPARTFAALRVGASSAAGNGRAEYCGEVSPLARLSFEACGTGATWFHTDPAPEMMHLRLRWAALADRLGEVQLAGLVGAGVAELQVGEDGAGLSFTGVEPGGVATAGPEGAVMLRAVLPAAVGIELVGELSLGAAYLPHAGELSRPTPTVPVFFSATVGAGF